LICQDCAMLFVASRTRRTIQMVLGGTLEGKVENGHEVCLSISRGLG
jgi:hypothetical protein